MAQELLVGERLTPEMIASGANLVLALDKLKVLVRGAFWILLPDQNAWRLIIASPEVRTLGPKAMYKKIRSALNALPTNDDQVATKDISVIDDKEPLNALLRSAIHTGPGISGVRFTGNVINGTTIDDAYIYRTT